MKRLTMLSLSLFVLISLVLAGCGGAASDTTVQVATDATWPPFEMVDEGSKEIVGFDIDLLNAIADEAGFQVQFSNVGFDPLLAGMATCQYDAAISAITITEDRKQEMLFSDPYFSAGQIIVVRQENSDIAAKEDLSGKEVGAQIGTTGAIEVEGIDGAMLKTYDDIGLAFQDLINGQVDAVVADDGLARGYVATNSDTLKVASDPFTDESYGIAVCKDNEALVEQINQGLQAVKDNGTMDQLVQKWFVEGGQ